MSGAWLKLDELIRARMQQLGLSYRQVVERARQLLGDDVAGASVHALANGPITEYPKMRTIRTLAAGLDVSERDIGDACAASLELHTYAPRDHQSQTGDSYLIVSPETLDSETERTIRDALPPTSSSCENPPPEDDEDSK